MRENTRNEHNHIDKSLRDEQKHFTYLIWKAIITWLMCFISNYSINETKSLLST